MKTTPTHTVFTLRDEKGKVKYVSSTTGSVDKRLQEMMYLALTPLNRNYNTPVSEWLREVHASFKMAGFALEGTFPNAESAKEKKKALIKSNPDCLNVQNNKVPFVEQK